ncbi:alanine/glycine:cation symporter family protein [Paracoccus xiamenensis]|uniref:alanine/glycine:cation symporter family protein n=1 Tax=Paracoccus xiamenensis TaxID=2714901 RepID=UPI00140AE76C|nr:sodium:alanine symporter family protein [Paracoccus xiamenensis]NHF73638.1 sodium:alanine symporter family protein [Paracoccus xiamenensis]
MESIHNFVSWLNGIVWGVPMIVLILGTGLYLQIRLGFLPIRKIGYGFRMIAKSRKPDEMAEGEITPFAALMTALSATIGTGNIAGVATAIALGGPGAVFWMWMTAFVGMATKYAEVVVAVHYRQKDEQGEMSGGPMYAIRNGLGPRWGWLAAAFAIFGGLAGFGIGNMVQSNSIAEAMQTAFGVPNWVIGLVLAVLTGAVVLGGIRRIGAVAERLVPTMAIIYVVAVLVVLILNASAVPGAFMTILTSAFSPTSAVGGFAGAAVMAGIRYGVARGIFSNEAGLGTAGIAQAAGATRDPVYSGMIGMMGTFIDTIVICTMTALAIMVTGVWTSGESGAALSAAAFETALPGMGEELLALLLSVFAFTTILGWAFYGEKCWEFLFGSKVETPFRLLWTIAVFVGTVVSLDFAWLVADTLNALMAIPNLISLIVLTPVVLMLTREYLDKHRND